MFYFHNYYYIVLILQAICVFHCVRKGRQTNWIWLIVFVPVIGCLVYIFSEIITGRELNNMQSGVGSLLNPGGAIKKLETNLRYSDTFSNRIQLADAYLATGEYEKAVGLYLDSLQGNFEENEYVFTQLIIAYYHLKQYDEIIPIAKKIYRLPQFARSRAHIYYAVALGYVGQAEQAEQEFGTMKARFSNFEARYEYALFLIRANRQHEAKQVLLQLIDESSQLSQREKRLNQDWFTKARNELKKTG